MAAQYRSQHFLHRRLAARTGNAEHKRVHIIAPRLRQLAADWKDVKRAGLAPEENLSFGRLGYTVPISCSKMKYQDLDTGKIFLSYTYCKMKWGFLARNLAVNNTSTSLYFPKDARNIDHMVNIGNLLENGESQ